MPLEARLAFLLFDLPRRPSSVSPSPGGSPMAGRYSRSPSSLLVNLHFSVEAHSSGSTAAEQQTAADGRGRDEKYKKYMMPADAAGETVSAGPFSGPEFGPLRRHEACMSKVVNRQVKRGAVAHKLDSRCHSTTINTAFAVHRKKSKSLATSNSGIRQQ